MSPFGRISRAARIERGLLLGDVASFLKVTPSYISQIESGTKRIPDGFIDKLAKHMELSSSEIADFYAAADVSAPSYTINIEKNAADIDREIAFQLQEGFARLDENRKRRILKELKGITRAEG